MAGWRVRGLVTAVAVPRTDAALMQPGQRSDATQGTAWIWVFSQVQAHTERVADRTGKPKLLIGMRVLLCGATLMPMFGYSKSRYFALLPGKKQRVPLLTDVRDFDLGAVNAVTWSELPGSSISQGKYAAPR